MTINAGNFTPKVRYLGDDATTAFPTGFRFILTSHLLVTLRDADGNETVQVLGTDYTVTGENDANGGTVTMTTAPATGEVLVVELNVPGTQGKSFPLGGSFPSTEVEEAFDLLTQRVNQLEALFDRAFRVATTDSQLGDNLLLPTEVQRASKFFAWDALGRAIAAAGTSANLGPVSAFIDTLLDDADAATARATLGALQNVITTRGDLIRGSASGIAERLALGAAGQVLGRVGDDLGYVDSQTLSAALPQDYSSRLTFSNGGGTPDDTEHDVTIQPFSVRSNDNTTNIVTTAKLTKQIDAAFAEGDNAGGLSTGSVAPNTTYYMWGAAKADGTPDWFFDPSATTPTLPTGFTKVELLGACRTDGSSNIINDHFTIYNQGGALDGIFLSEEQVLAAATTLTFQHELLNRPVTVEAIGVCTTAEFGYVAGDTIEFSNPGTGNVGWTIETRDSQILFINDRISGVRKDTNVAVLFTDANWNVKLIARG